MSISLPYTYSKGLCTYLGNAWNRKIIHSVYDVKALLIRGASTLLKSYTNSAVDNLLMKLKAQVAYREIWSSHRLKGPHSTSCQSSFVLDTSDGFSQQQFSKGNKFIYRFVRQSRFACDSKTHDGASSSSAFSQVNDLNCTLRSEGCVILSSRAVANGIIMDISRAHVSVSFSKRLRLPGRRRSSISRDLYQEVWRLDKDESMSSFAIMRYNLTQLLLQTEHSSHVRKMIVDQDSKYEKSPLDIEKKEMKNGNESSFTIAFKSLYQSPLVYGQKPYVYRSLSFDFLRFPYYWHSRDYRNHSCTEIACRTEDCWSN